MTLLAKLPKSLIYLLCQNLHSMGYPEIKQAFLTRKQTLKEVHIKTIVVTLSGEDVTIEMLIKENEALKNS